jgi:hypothetical protein
VKEIERKGKEVDEEVEEMRRKSRGEEQGRV